MRKLIFKTPMVIAVVSFLGLVFIVVPSFPVMRNMLAAPLVVHEPNACGDACYVLAGGGALSERLDAAADLVQMKRVSRILLMQDNVRSQFNFKTNTSWIRTEWIADYLAWRGVPVNRIRWIPQVEGQFGTLTEARTLANNLPKDVKTLVVVSSAPHMRRSVLTFRRSLPADVKIVPYAATEFVNSYEMHHPIWLEYTKLLVYQLLLVL